MTDPPVSQAPQQTSKGVIGFTLALWLVIQLYAFNVTLSPDQQRWFLNVQPIFESASFGLALACTLLAGVYSFTHRSLAPAIFTTVMAYTTLRSAYPLFARLADPIGVFQSSGYSAFEETLRLTHACVLLGCAFIATYHAIHPQRAKRVFWTLGLFFAATPLAVFINPAPNVQWIFDLPQLPLFALSGILLYQYYRLRPSRIRWGLSFFAFLECGLSLQLILSEHGQVEHHAIAALVLEVLINGYLFVLLLLHHRDLFYIQLLSLERIEEQNQEQTQMLHTLKAAMTTLTEQHRDLEQFAYVATHDLKAPLRAISSLASWIHDDLPEEVDPDIPENLGLLQQRVDRMNRLLNELLEFARLGTLDSPAAPLSTENLIKQVIASLSLSENIEVKLTSDAPMITTSSTALEQVFTQLIKNAIEHHPGPNVRVEISCTSTPDRYTFYIDDNGEGIDPHYHDKVFRVFQTIKSRDQREASGIGLAIVKKRVEKAGGTVHFIASPLGGTRFVFSWPKHWPEDLLSTLSTYF